MAAFDADAEDVFCAAVSSVLPGSSASDCTIKQKEKVSRRRALLAAGLKVDYEV